VAYIKSSLVVIKKVGMLWQLGMVAVFSSNFIGHINKVILHWAGLLLRLVTVLRYLSCPGQLSLAIHLWVGEMSIGYR